MLEIQNAKPGDAAAATSDWGQGYGYQFWRCKHDCYRGDGAFGQFCIVLPKQDAVIAITGEYGDMQRVLNAAWEHLLPAFATEGLAADDATAAQLTKKLAALALPLPVGKPTSPVVQRAKSATYDIGDNGFFAIKEFSFDFEPDKCVATFIDAHGKHRVECGLGNWRVGDTDLSAVPLKLVPTTGPGEAKMKIAGSAAWSDDNTLVMLWRFIETAHYQSVTCRLDGDQVRIDFQKSLAILNPGAKGEVLTVTGKLRK